MIKIKDLKYRSLWYKKNYYYLKSGQSLSLSTKTSSNCMETLQIHQEIDEGLKLSDILQGEDFKNIFSKTEISFIKVAERTGNIDKTFLTLSELLKDRYILKQKLISTLIYPILVLFMTLLLIILILFIIIPKVSTLFKDLKNLPISTKIIIFLSEHLINYWYIDLFILFILFFFFILFKNNQIINSFYKKIRLKFLYNFIFIKDMYIYWNIEQWLKIIYMSIESGLNISQSLFLSCDSLENDNFKRQFNEVYLSVNKGDTCANSLKLLDIKIYRKIMDWESIIASGEKTGKSKDVFEICYINIKEDLLNSIDRFQKIIEPVLIIFVGIIVMIICISIILPMYQLTQSLQ